MAAAGFLSSLSEWSFTRKGKEMFYLTTLNTFYLRLNGVRHMVKDHSDSEKGGPLPYVRRHITVNKMC